ncbi:MAG: hypothetical protein QOF74_3537 [Caballeronia mineralivorans]|jgi:hypothetical protein|nr:hypothetical protein [Caballeronia mineralivorans]
MLDAYKGPHTIVQNEFQFEVRVLLQKFRQTRHDMQPRKIYPAETRSLPDRPEAFPRAASTASLPSSTARFAR